jgi:DNA-binding FrmR family transcriptional regulator
MNYDVGIQKRLRRVEGQVRGILKMIDEGQDCKEVVSQLSAARSALDKAMAYIVAMNLEQCIMQNQETGKDSQKVIEEAVELLIKSR